MDGGTTTRLRQGQPAGTGRQLQTQSDCLSWQVHDAQPVATGHVPLLHWGGKQLFVVQLAHPPVPWARARLWGASRMLAMRKAAPMEPKSHDAASLSRVTVMPPREVDLATSDPTKGRRTPVRVKILGGHP
jgi:hypothetical protein